jgi:hypothetical protein
MSALPPKADIRPRDQDVCFGPKGDIVTVVRHNERGRQLSLQIAAKTWLEGQAASANEKGGRIFARYATSSDRFSVRKSLIDSLSVGNETSDPKQALHVGHSQM